jgi:hypothetical protein
VIKNYEEKNKRLELAARTKLANLFICHKQIGKEQVRGKVDE